MLPNTFHFQAGPVTTFSPQEKSSTTRSTSHQTTPSGWAGRVEKGKPSPAAGRNIKWWVSYCGKVWLFFKLLNTDLFYPPAPPLLRIQPKATEKHVHTDSSQQHYSPNMATPKCPSADERTPQMGPITQRNTTQQQKVRNHWHSVTQRNAIYAIHRVPEARHRRQGSLWFHLQEKSRIGKSIKAESRAELPAAEMGMGTDCKWEMF